MLLPPHRILSRTMVSCQAHPPPLWEDPAQISEVLMVVMNDGLRVAGGGAWPGAVGGQPLCRGRKQCCWLYPQTSSEPQSILAHQKVSFFTPCDTSHTPKATDIFGCISAPGQKIMCKLTHAAYFWREGSQFASCLWEEVFLQRMMDDENLGYQSGSPFSI